MGPPIERILLWVQPETWSIARGQGWDIDLVRNPPTSRRALLLGMGAVGTVALVSSCVTNSPNPVPLESEPMTPTDVQVESELQLIALYSAITRAFPDLATASSAIADQHRAHARALGYDADIPAEVIPVPPTARQALRVLIDAEERATRERRDGCATEPNPERVRLLTLIAASEGSHIPELTRLAESST
jgi:hypothetical protein